MDNRNFENTLRTINAIIEQLLEFQETMRKKDLSELRTIEASIFSISNVRKMTKDELIVEIVRSRAKMLEPKEEKKDKNEEGD